VAVFCAALEAFLLSIEVTEKPVWGIIIAVDGKKNIFSAL